MLVSATTLAGKRAEAGGATALITSRGHGQGAASAHSPLPLDRPSANQVIQGSLSPNRSLLHARVGPRPPPQIEFLPDQIYWFNQKAHIKITNTRQQCECFAGKVLKVTSTLIQWAWLYAPHISFIRGRDILNRQKPALVTDSQQLYLSKDATLTLREAQYLISKGAQPGEQIHFTPLDFNLKGFRNTDNRQHWSNLLTWLQHEFDPEIFLIRRINAIPPPKGKSQKLWVQCIKSLVNLQKQNMIQHDDGTYVPDPLFDKLTMLSKCLPILLLRVPPAVAPETKAAIITKNCERFLEGAWQGLALAAQQDLEVCNIFAQGKNAAERRPPPDSAQTRLQQVLEKTRLLQYSKAMNLLRSPGLARQPLDVILQILAGLHPAESEQDLSQARPPDEDGAFNSSTFDFITGAWFARQIKTSSRGTAVDQWGWDTREMWEPFTYDHELMNDLAEVWVRPLAAGYLPSQYRQILIGGRLIALSKYPKPGVRPICISDALRRLVGKGLLKKCQLFFQQYFQESAPNVIQFGGSIPNGATFMHLLLSAIHDFFSTEPAQSSLSQEDPFVILSLDSSNAFNCLSREQLFKVLLDGCNITLKSPTQSGASQPMESLPQGWNLLWHFIA